MKWGVVPDARQKESPKGAFAGLILAKGKDSQA